MGKDDLLKFDVPGLSKSYTGAMVDDYPSGDFLSGRYIKRAKIIGHTNIE